MEANSLQGEPQPLDLSSLDLNQVLKTEYGVRILHHPLDELGRPQETGDKVYSFNSPDQAKRFAAQFAPQMQQDLGVKDIQYFTRQAVEVYGPWTPAETQPLTEELLSIYYS